MSRDPQQFDFASMFRIDVSPSGSTASESEENMPQAIVGLMRQLVAGQNRQNQLLEELVNHMSAAQKQRQVELGQWKEANPELSRACRRAAETLSRVQTQFLDSLTYEVSENEDVLLDGEFMLNEFVDRFGPRLAHLNGVLQVLSQLSSVQNTANAVQ